MLRKFFSPAVLLISSLSLAGCNVINPGELTPTYVHVDSFAVAGNGQSQGSLSHRITNVWAYYNNAPLGSFDLPATFPVRADAPGTLTLLAGIDFDGLRGYELPYPLYTSDTLRLTPQPGAQINHNAVVKYASNVSLKYNADFESGAAAFTHLAGDTGLVTVSGPGNVFEGAGSGAIFLDAAKDSAVVSSITGFSVPYNTEAFLEVDYKGTMSLTIGMSTTVSSTNRPYAEYLIALKPRATWGKFYIGIKEFVSGHQGLDYHILIGARKQEGATTGELFIDNLKVVSL